LDFGICRLEFFRKTLNVIFYPHKGKIMYSSRYKTAGWLSIFVAIIFVPKFVASFVIGIIALEYHFPGMYILDAILTIPLTVVFVYLLITFRFLLNERYNFHDVDKLITISYWCLIITGFISILDDSLKTVGISGPNLTTPDIVLLITFFSVFYVLGIVSIIYGIRLLRLKGDLFGMLKVYVYTTIAGGVCLVSIILFPLSLIVAVATYILEGMIFLRAAEDEEFV